MEEGGARGKAGTGDGSGVRGSRGAGVGTRVDGAPNGDMVLWGWEVGAAAGMGTSGCVRADIVR